MDAELRAHIEAYTAILFVRLSPAEAERSARVEFGLRRRGWCGQFSTGTMGIFAAALTHRCMKRNRGANSASRAFRPLRTWPPRDNHGEVEKDVGDKRSRSGHLETLIPVIGSGV